MIPFLKFRDGAIPGKVGKRPPAIDSEKIALEKRKKYEKKRPDRVFSESWKINREWLEYDETHKTMKCKVCVDYYNSDTQRPPTGNLKGQNTFIMNGSGNLKKSAIIDHEQCKSHITASQITRARQSNQHDIAVSKAGRTLQSLKASDRYKIAYLVRNAHAVAKQNRPLTDYTWLAKLDKAKGIDLGDTYINEKAALRFIACIADNQRDEIKNLLEKTPFFSFMMDGSTDIAGDEQESIYLRTALSGNVYEKFLHIGSPSSTASNDLHTFLHDVFNSTGIEKFARDGKLIGMGSDGASNMTGCKGGLATLMKREYPELLSIHCLCHRLELAFRDALKGNKSYEKMNTVLIGLFYFYTKSDKQKKGLLAAMKCLNINGLLPPKLKGTRWLPHLTRAINSLSRTYPAYDAHLGSASHGNAKAEGLAKLLLDKHLMAFILLLQELLDPLHKLSLQLQKGGVTLADVHTWSESTVELLEECKTKNSTALNTLLDSGTYHGVPVTKGTGKLTLSYKDSLIDNLIKAITARFSLHESQSGIIEATRICNFKCWPAQGSEAVQDYGDSEITSVLNHYSQTTKQAGVDEKDIVLREWRLLKKLVYKRHGTKMQFLQWSDVHSEFSDTMPNVLLLFDLLFSLPPTSVSCETSFNQMKLIKTNRRSRLRSTTLNDLMMVKLESPSVDKFVPDEVIDRWIAAPLRQRRLNYRRRTAETINNDRLVQLSNEDIICDKDQPDIEGEPARGHEVADQHVDVQGAKESVSGSQSSDDEDRDIEELSKAMVSDSGDFSDYEDESNNASNLMKYASDV